LEYKSQEIWFVMASDYHFLVLIMFIIKKI